MAKIRKRSNPGYTEIRSFIPNDVKAELDRARTDLKGPKEKRLGLDIATEACIRLFLAYPPDAQFALIRRVRQPDRFPDAWKYIRAQATKLPFSALAEPEPPSLHRQ